MLKLRNRECHKSLKAILIEFRMRQVRRQQADFIKEIFGLYFARLTARATVLSLPKSYKEEAKIYLYEEIKDGDLIAPFSYFFGGISYRLIKVRVLFLRLTSFRGRIHRIRE